MSKFSRITAALWGGAVICTALALGTTAVAQQAQQPAQQQAQTHVAATHGDWTIRCSGAAPEAGAEGDDDGKGDLQPEDAETGEQPAAGAAPPQCVMVQIARHSDQENLGISVIIVRQTVQDQVVSQMRITTPISVFLPAGVGFEIDGTAVGRLPYEVCSPQGVCVATVFIDAELADKMKRGSLTKFYLKDVRGADGVFSLSLSGFTAAFDALDKSGS